MNRRILSSDNQYIKLTASLQQKKYRDETGLFVVEGLRLVREALDSSWGIELAMVSDEEAGGLRIQSLIEALGECDCPILAVPPALFRKISDTENPQGILAVVRQRRYKLTELPPQGASPLWVILDALQDPGNVGTVIRTADAAGAAGVILSEGCADLYAGKTVRATMGSLFHIPVLKTSINECLSFCEANRLTLYTASLEDATRYSDVNLTEPCAIVFGNEGAGVGDEYRRRALLNITIPIVGRAESLNVASAAAVILYESLRQRGFTL